MNRPLRAAWMRWGGIDFFLLLRVFVFAASVPGLLRLKLATLQWLLGRVPVCGRPDPARVRAIMRCMTIVLRRGQPLVRRGCLTRGVTLFYFLRRAGLDVDLCFGAGGVGGEFAAHCWLERDGAPFLEDVDPRGIFAEMYRVPGARPQHARRAEIVGLPRWVGRP